MECFESSAFWRGSSRAPEGARKKCATASGGRALTPATMNLPRLFGLFGLSLLALGAVACASSETVTTTKPVQEESSTIPTNATVDAESFCTTLCDRQESCDKSLDVQTCKNACTNQNAAVFPKLREDVVSLIVECFGAKDCKTVLQGDVVGTCASEAVASVAPSAAAKTYCTQYEGAKKKCGTAVTTSTCLNEAKLYDDDAIAQAANCNGRPCAEIDTCVSAAFGEIGGGKVTKPPTQTSCSTTQFSDLGTCSSCAAGSCCAEASACAADSMCRTLMRYCAYGSSGGSSSTCSSYMSSASSTSRDLVTSYFSCAQSKCSSDCSYYYGG